MTGGSTGAAIVLALLCVDMRALACSCGQRHHQAPSRLTAPAGTAAAGCGATAAPEGTLTAAACRCFPRRARDAPAALQPRAPGNRRLKCAHASRRQLMPAETPPGAAMRCRLLRGAHCNQRLLPVARQSLQATGPACGMMHKRSTPAMLQSCRFAALQQPMGPHGPKCDF